MKIFDEAKSAHWKKKVSAGDIGTFVHNWVEDYINGKNPKLPVNKDLRGAVQRFLDWQKEYNVRFLLAEQQVYSLRRKYTGTLDFICEIDGKMYIGDLKTSNAIYKNEMGQQLAAYKMAREEEFPEEKYEGCVLVRIGKKDGEFEIWKLEDDSLYRKTFLYALKLYNAVNLLKTNT